MRAALVRALCACAGNEKRYKARRFLQGLSADELQYIAEFLGSCILDHRRQTACTRGELAEGITQYERCRKASRPAPKCASQFRSDDDHKMILLLEYLCRCELTQSAVAVRAAKI